MEMGEIRPLTELKPPGPIAKKIVTVDYVYNISMCYKKIAKLTNQRGS